LSSITQRVGHLRLAKQLLRMIAAAMARAPARTVENAVWDARRSARVIRTVRHATDPLHQCSQPGITHLAHKLRRAERRADRPMQTIFELFGLRSFLISMRTPFTQVSSLTRSVHPDIAGQAPRPASECPAISSEIIMPTKAADRFSEPSTAQPGGR